MISLHSTWASNVHSIVAFLLWYKNPQMKCVNARPCLCVCVHQYRLAKYKEHNDMMHTQTQSQTYRCDWHFCCDWNDDDSHFTHVKLLQVFFSLLSWKKKERYNLATRSKFVMIESNLLVNVSHVLADCWNCKWTRKKKDSVWSLLRYLGSCYRRILNIGQYEQWTESDKNNKCKQNKKSSYC